MKKELLIAIVIGLLLGLVVTFGIYTARRNSSIQESAELLASGSPGVMPNTSPNSSLVISSPEDGLITSNKELQVSGTTEADAFVFIFFDGEYRIEKADGTGNFSTKITLKEGPMIIQVRTLDEAGNSTEDERAVFIGDPSEFSVKASPSPSPRVTPRVTPRASVRPSATPKASPAQ
jgi:hypothetical protein